MQARATDGMIAGLTGTAALTGAIAVGKLAGRMPLSAPREIGWRLHERTGLPDRPLWTLGHFGYGAACGAIYAALRPLLPGPPAAAGAAFGLGVWALSYLALMPRLGLYPPARWDHPGRRRVMIAGHLVYGIVLGLLTDRRASRSPRAP